MFDASFAMLFRAIDRIRCQLATADEGLRRVLGEELLCLKRLGEQYIDHWMTLEEQIADLLDTYQLRSAPPSGLVVAQAAPPSQSSPSGIGPLSHSVPTPNRTFVKEDFMTPDLDELSGAETWGWNHSDKVAVSFRRGLAYYDLFMFADAAKSLEEVVEETDTPIPRLYLAASYAADHRVEPARKLLAAVRLSTRDPLFLCAADEIEAQLLIDSGAYGEAVRVLERIAARIPKYPDVWFNLCICHVNMGQYGLAEGAAIRALRLDPSDNETAMLLGAVRLKLGKLTEAQEICTFAMNRQPQHFELMKLMASIARERGEYEQAIRMAHELVHLFPHEEDAWSQLSWLYMKTGQQARARASLKQQLSLFPRQAQALLQLGILLLLEQDHDAAERILMNCLANHPNKSLVWIALGVISLTRGDDAQAHTRFLRATKDTRKDVRRLALYQFGKALLRVDRCDEAETYLRAAASLGKPSPAITRAMAEAAERQGRPLEAAKLIRKAESAIQCQELD